jgi:hypothetical protein
MTMTRTRWLVSAVGLVALWACNDRKIQTPVPAPTGTSHNFFEQNLNNNIDILFLVDDSSSMTTVQQNVAMNFPVFINILTSLPTRPNMHIAVTTSSMGAGAFTSSVPGCMAPDLGNFVYQIRAATDPACQTNKLNTNEHFFQDLNNGASKNYTGDLATAFGCVAQVGANGCGFEHQMAGVRAALGDPMMNLPAPAGNANFLRDDAYLAIIWITNEDDCSAPPDSQLFDPNQNAVTDPLGPLASFRCTEFGILCNGQKPPRQAAGPLMGCTSNDGAAASDPMHSLVPAQFYIDYFKRVKPVPNHIIAAAIVANTDPFSVVIDQQTGFPSLAHSCSSSNGTFGDPPIRIKQIVDSFGALGTITSICQNSYADAFGVIANLIGRQLGRQCVDGVLALAPDFTMPVPAIAPGSVVDPATVSCTVDDVQYIGTPMQKTLRTIQPCAQGGQQSGACWALVGDAMCNVSGAKVVVCRNGFNPSNAMMPCPDGPNAAEDGVTAVINCATIPH